MVPYMQSEAHLVQFGSEWFSRVPKPFFRLFEQFVYASFCLTHATGAPGGGALPSNRLMGMCCWMGSHFHDWINNGVAFSTELLEWGRIFSGFGGNTIQASREFVY